MKKIKKLLLTLSLSDNIDDSESEETTDNDIPTHLSIGENKNAETLKVTFHPDAFLCNNIEIYDEPPLDIDTNNNNNNNYKPFIFELKQYSYKISFNITISPKLCDLGYVRVNTIEFLNSIKPFIPICISFLNDIFPRREYLYIPITIGLPINHQTHGLFDDILTPTLIIIPSHPKLYRYKLTESFLWRYQYVRIREFPSLKMNVIGEIPCDLSFQIIGYPICAILANFYSLRLDNDRNNNYNIINKDLNERKSIIDVAQWSVFENSYWIKIQPNILKKLPLMKRCIDELKQYSETSEYFTHKGYVIQQYLGHTVLKCIGPLNGYNNNKYNINIPISFDKNNNLFIHTITNNEINIFDGFPIELISHIISFCDFEFITNVLSCISKEFYISSLSPSCYHTAIIPSNLINKNILPKLCKCKRVDIYSLICEDNIDYKIDNNNCKNNNYKINNKCENIIEEFHLEFVTQSILHMKLFNIFNFNNNLKILKLTQCGNISEITLNYLPNNLQELCLMNTIINIKTWNNLSKLSSLIITKSANLHEMDNNKTFLKLIVETLPKQILKSICIWDGEEDNLIIIQQLIESHNNVLNIFGIGGRICLYHPFSTIFTSLQSKAYIHLEIITVSCLATHEIIQLIKEFGYQLRILELFCPFVMDEQQDIYHWLLNDNNIELFCKSLTKLQILMCQGFPLHMKKYMINNKWNELKNKFINKFMKYRNNKNNIPIILFDFGIDLNKVSLWKGGNIHKYLIQNQQKLELNYGNGI